MCLKALFRVHQIIVWCWIPHIFNDVCLVEFSLIIILPFEFNVSLQILLFCWMFTTERINEPLTRVISSVKCSWIIRTLLSLTVFCADYWRRTSPSCSDFRECRRWIDTHTIIVASRIRNISNYTITIIFDWVYRAARSQYSAAAAAAERRCHSASKLTPRTVLLIVACAINN